MSFPSKKSVLKISQYKTENQNYVNEIAENVKNISKFLTNILCENDT